MFNNIGYLISLNHRKICNKLWECTMSEKTEFKIGEVCPESGIYRLKNYQDVSEEQAEIPLTKGEKFPPCKNCKDEVIWVLVRKATLDGK